MVGDRYFEPQVETMPREQLGALQEERVLELVEYAYAHSPFYRELWDAHGVHPRDIRTLDDFRARIPFITKDMIRAHRARTGDPFGGLLCVRPDELTSVSSSSGTTGDPEFFAEIWEDAPPLVTAQVRDLWELGLRPGDRVLSPPGTFRNLMDPGFQALGAVVIEVDTWIGRMHEVVEALRKYRPAYLQMIYPQMVELEHLAEKTDLKEAFSSLKGASCGQASRSAGRCASGSSTTGASRSTSTPAPPTPAPPGSAGSTTASTCGRTRSSPSAST